jgi:para-aminobenzoate synthetase / 4-amino-4-deoxychorismate lyase
MAVRTEARVIRRALGWSLAAADVLRLVRGDAHPVALSGNWAGEIDVVGSEPIAVRDGAGSLEDVFDASFPVDPSAAARGDVASFGGGWIGYLGYAAGGEALPARPGGRLPTLWFGFYDHVLVRDRATGEWAFEALWTDGRDSELERRFAELVQRAEAVPRAAACEFSPFRLLPGADGHRKAVRKAVEYIHCGDIFQANICLRAEAGCVGDPLDAFCRAAGELSPPYAAFVGVSAPQDARRAAQGTGGGRTAVASLSPELFLRRAAGAGGAGGTVVSKPIKGTARRSGDASESAAQRAGLTSSAKNRAENVMIVDLVRNDLARVCEPGSIAVPTLLGAEPHPGVWHLVSTVQGKLAKGRSDGDLIRAAFPPGSVTGAPKVRALEIIDELESASREVYTGAVGYRSPVAGMELNVAIRTFEFIPGKSWIGAGGGIVADSSPDAEYAEAILKVTPLLAAIGATLDTSPGNTDAGAARPTGPAEAISTQEAAVLGALRPRATAGVFTSLTVTDGRTRDLAVHLARLATSVEALYGKVLPKDLRATLRERLADRPSGRLRITVRPVGGPLQATVEVIPLPSPPSAGAGQAGSLATPVTLRSAIVPGGIGEHKYKDRRLLADLTARPGAAPGDHVLIADETGELLETDKANVFAVIGGVLLTPPADGRVLPGVTRAAVLRAAHGRGIRVGQKPLTLGEMASATEVFVTNSVTGITPVAAIDGCPTAWQPGPVTTALTEALAAVPLDPVPTGPAPASYKQARPVRGSGKSRAGGKAPLIVLVDNYDSFTWNLAHLLSVSGARVDVVRNDEVTAAQVAGLGPAGVLISPGPCAPAEAGISIETVRACAAARIPLLGICLGHQAIAAAYGAQVVRAPQPVHGMAFPVRHDGRGVLADLPHPFQATRYHSLIVDEATLPSELRVTAITGRILMGLRHVSDPVEGVQFHPESILTAHGRQLIRTFVQSAHITATD